MRATDVALVGSLVGSLVVNGVGAFFFFFWPTTTTTPASPGTSSDCGAVPAIAEVAFCACEQQSIGPCELASTRKRRAGRVVVARSGADARGVDDDHDGDGDVERDDALADVVDDVLDAPLQPTSLPRPERSRSTRGAAGRYTPAPLGCDPFGCDEVNREFIARFGAGVGGGTGFGGGAFVPLIASASVGPTTGLRVGVDAIGAAGFSGAHGGVFVGPRVAVSPFDGVRLEAGLSAGLGGGLDVVGPSALVPLSASFAAADNIDIVVGVVAGGWPTLTRHVGAGAAGPCPPGTPTTTTTTERGTELWMGLTLGLSTDVVLR